jgi:DNA-binding response OmpR family regulator
LPGGSGLHILKALRENNKADGVLIISAKNAIDDKVEGLVSGADDYLSKPFHLSELSARIAAIIRRKKFDGNNVIQFNDISIDTQAKTAAVSKNNLDLTKKEFELLLYFVSNKRRVISKMPLPNICGEMKWKATSILFTPILKTCEKNYWKPEVQTI